MKQHEALCLAINSPLGDAAKWVLVALVAKLDWETWAKPMSVSYIEKALRTKSRSTISRGLAELQAKGIIERHDIEGRVDGVRLIKLNTSALTTLCQIDTPPSVTVIQPPMSERHTPSVSVTYPPMSERHTPSVSVTYPLCQPDTPPMSERHTPYVTVTDNIISNNQLSNLNDNLNDNQSEQTKSLNSAIDWGGSEEEAVKDNSSFWGTSSGRGLRPATQPKKEKSMKDRIKDAEELMKRSYR